MRLSKLSLAGFKSFAKATTLEFPVAVSAIVGPNGSGKSNVAEAIRWVLGEQSMKSLRGKRGEDLIFNGSPTVPRMGKASVGLTFNNKDHAIPLDFDEVTMERKIFRDGTNEYYLNSSQVRLKDVVELLARMGLGETKHNIISQGEVDRILLAPPRDRRTMLEEAIGLRIHQLRKREAERKLDETGGNMTQIQSLLRELQPHVKFLKSQADKAERRETVQKELEEHYCAYVQKEHRAITAEERRLAHEQDPAAVKLKDLERDIALVSREIDEAGGVPGRLNELGEKRKDIESLEARRRELERELGRLEGKMEITPVLAARATQKYIEAVIAERNIRPIAQALQETIQLEDLGEIRRRITTAATELESLIEQWAHSTKQSDAKPDSGELSRRHAELQKELKILDASLEKLRRAMNEELERTERAQTNLRERFERLRALEDEANGIRANLQRVSFEHERLELRREELERTISESGIARQCLIEGATSLTAAESEDLKKKIEKLRARLEEIGGIDPAVLKEYQDAKTRYEFLERELNDLRAADKDLRSLITELEKRIESDFKKGFEKIRNEFQDYFKIIFGGGKGVLSSVPIRHTTAAEEEDAEVTEEENGVTEYGIEVDVDLPRKRIKGLAMLSGGERALVSIALLFAITAVNPPPFLILDETDAALDEANSQKYAAILKELSKKTQLILVTHNRETMKQAGILYGVTMGDDGVSKLLSLKLDEAKVYGNR